MSPEDIANLASALQGITVTTVLGIACTVLWKSWREERLEREKERDELLAKIDQLQTERVNDARKWGESVEQMLHGSLTGRGL